MKQVFGNELKIGDVIEVWWNPNRDTIIDLQPYKGKYENDSEWKGVQIATFAMMKCGMTIFPNDDFIKIN